MTAPLRPLTPAQPSRRQLDSGVLAYLFCLLVTLGMALTNDRLWHWFLIPVLLCGLLTTRDAIDWLRGRLDVFDPAGLLGLIGVHFFFLAPLIYIQVEAAMAYVIQPPDWRPLLGQMALLNCAGLVVYQTSRDWISPRGVPRPPLMTWRLDERLFTTVWLVVLAITALLQLRVYSQFGGLMGYINAFESHTNAFKGMGWQFMISESFPIVAFIGYAVFARKHATLRTWPAIFTALATYFVLRLLFGGLRGSRSNTIWGLFWAVGIVHYWIRPISRRLIYVGLVFLIGFMYLYGFYKSAGLEGMLNAFNTERREVLEAETGRTLETALLGDLSRCDVQAYVLYQIEKPGSVYELSWGRTYVGAAALLIPGSIWPDRPPTKVFEGTEILSGPGTYIPEEWMTSRVFGLAGETMLNFGPWAVPFSFLALTAAVVALRYWLVAWPTDDPRRLMIPYLINLVIIILIGDSDNVLYFLITSGSVPFLLLLASSQHSVLRAARPLTARTPHRLGV